MKAKVIRRLSDLKAVTVEEATGGGGREWTAEILKDGRKLYAWMAYNPAFDTFATDILGHARMFGSEADVERWSQGLGIPNAIPVKVRKGKVIAPAVRPREGES